MRYSVKFSDNYGYGTEVFEQSFKTFEEAFERYSEIKNNSYCPPHDLEIVDKVAEAESKIAKLKEEIAKLEIFIKIAKGT